MNIASARILDRYNFTPCVVFVIRNNNIVDVADLEYIALKILNEIILRISAAGRTVRYCIGTARLVVVVEEVCPRAPLLGDKTVSVVVVIFRHTAGGFRLAKPAEEVGEIYGRAADNGARRRYTL